MAKKDVLEIVRETAELAAKNADCELVDVEFIKEGAYWYLRIYIDKEGGVSLDDCEAVNAPISAMLDEKDPITQAYFLEVSSPGLGRPLKTARDYEKSMNQVVEVKLFKNIEGRRQLEGTLIAYDGHEVTIQEENEQKTILNISDIAKINCKVIV
jgi:ribosome maturation factor RimP